MPSPGFQFKQFYVKHDLCAMKVGTDGVLLGAWAGWHDDYQHILDIGTGSGLVALMLAQRFPHALLTGIDIDADAALQAADNFKASPWNKRLHAQHVSLQEFALSNTTRFDLIVSNPPFFQNSLKNPDLHRSTARHTDTLPHTSLVKIAADLLTEQGVLCVILPAEQTDAFSHLAASSQLQMHKRLDIYPTPQRPAKRTLLALSKTTPASPTHEKLIIEMEGRHNYSPDYLHLTSAFYLDK